MGIMKISFLTASISSVGPKIKDTPYGVSFLLSLICLNIFKSILNSHFDEGSNELPSKRLQ